LMLPCRSSARYFHQYMKPFRISEGDFHYLMKLCCNSAEYLHQYMKPCRINTACFHQKQEHNF
jgi:hypothetical protein